MKVYVGADYRGLSRKQELLKFLAGFDAEVVDMGIYAAPGDELSAEQSSDADSPEYDYNLPASAVAREVREDDASARGILICDSAHGMTIQANRYKGIRAANCDTAESARLAREHDDANVLCLSAHLTDEATMQDITKTFLTTDFQPLPRRVRRINRLDEGSDYD